MRRWECRSPWKLGGFGTRLACAGVADKVHMSRVYEYGGRKPWSREAPGSRGCGPDAVHSSDADPKGEHRRRSLALCASRLLTRCAPRRRFCLLRLECQSLPSFQGSVAAGLLARRGFPGWAGTSSMPLLLAVARPAFHVKQSAAVASPAATPPWPKSMVASPLHQRYGHRP